MPDAKKPNILVIWGDDIGITNLSCYSDGLMGYRDEHRPDRRRMRFTDSYGEQSCTAGRSSFITGQSVYRTGLSKVGVPGMDIGLQAEDVIAELLKPLGYATGAVRQEPPGRPEQVPPDRARLRRVLRQPLPPERGRGAGAAELAARRRLPHFRERFRPRGVIHSGQPTRTTTPRSRASAVVGGQRIEDTGPLNKPADGDDRRRGARARARLHRAPGRRRARSSSGSTRRTCTSGRTRSRASARPGAGSRPTTTR